ncbi:MAG: hypothetical protein RI947_854 [Candidatus Parcubacteria bacterium]|jgi:histidinol-phosphate/aromatic aminotransferase/cobyric acid decarboxylase-like protein
MFESFTRPVYAYYAPEVRAVVDTIVKRYPHNIFLQSIAPGLDTFHEPIIQKYMDTYKAYMPGLGSFPYRYVSGGSSESIFHILSSIAAQEKQPPLYIVEGEYEGYAGYGRNLRLQFTTVGDRVDVTTLAPGIFFISNPSSRNGNVHPREFISAVGDAGHEIMLDCAYVGMTDDTHFLVDHPAISTVFTSMSKPYGLYYYRVGFTFTRKPVKTLEVNKWFKNIFSLIVADRLLTELSPRLMYEKYRPIQQAIIDETNKKYSSNLRPSRVYQLAYALPEDIPAEQTECYRMFHRGGSYYRFGLTEEFLRRE